MAIDPAIKKTWIELQSRHSVPVNAVGVEIDPGDKFTLEVWKSEGIDQHMKKDPGS